MTPVTVDWARWRDQQVRDLAWCCLAPPLMESLPGTDATAWRAPASPDLTDWLDTLAADPEPLRRHLARVKSTRLGVYFEALWVFFWQHHPAVELLAYNRQVNRDGQTRGAFDFLLLDRRDGGRQYLHLEAAVKFYAGAHAGSTRWRDWVGPDSRDTLERKLTHLCQHQLPLSQDPELGQWRPVPGPPLAAFARRTLLAGRFYAPWETPRHLPAGGNRLLPMALWCHRHRFEEVMRQCFHGRRGKILDRHQWLAPALDEGDLHCGENLSRQLPQPLPRARQVAFFPGAGSGGPLPGVEECRLFVMPDHWPSTATPERNT